MKIKQIDELNVIGNRILVKVEKIKETTDGGIILTADTRKGEQDRMSEGTLLDFGALAFVDLVGDKEELPRAGDHLFFVKYAGKGITINDEEYRVINDEDVYALKREK